MFTFIERAIATFMSMIDLVLASAESGDPLREEHCRGMERPRLVSNRFVWFVCVTTKNSVLTAVTSANVFFVLWSIEHRLSLFTPVLMFIIGSYAKRINNDNMRNWYVALVAWDGDKDNPNEVYSGHAPGDICARYNAERGTCDRKSVLRNTIRPIPVVAVPLGNTYVGRDWNGVVGTHRVNLSTNDYNDCVDTQIKTLSAAVVVQLRETTTTLEATHYAQFVKRERDYVIPRAVAERGLRSQFACRRTSLSIMSETRVRGLENAGVYQAHILRDRKAPLSKSGSCVDDVASYASIASRSSDESFSAKKSDVCGSIYSPRSDRSTCESANDTDWTDVSRSSSGSVKRVEHTRKGTSCAKRVAYLRRKNSAEVRKQRTFAREDSVAKQEGVSGNVSKDWRDTQNRSAVRRRIAKYIAMFPKYLSCDVDDADKSILSNSTSSNDYEGVTLINKMVSFTGNTSMIEGQFNLSAMPCENHIKLAALVAGVDVPTMSSRFSRAYSTTELSVVDAERSCDRSHVIKSTEMERVELTNLVKDQTRKTFSYSDAVTSVISIKGSLKDTDTSNAIGAYGNCTEVRKKTGLKFISRLKPNITIGSAYSDRKNHKFNKQLTNAKRRENTLDETSDTVMNYTRPVGYVWVEGDEKYVTARRAYKKGQVEEIKLAYPDDNPHKLAQHMLDRVNCQTRDRIRDEYDDLTGFHKFDGSSLLRDDNYVGGGDNFPFFRGWYGRVFLGLDTGYKERMWDPEKLCGIDQNVDNRAAIRHRRWYRDALELRHKNGKDY